MSSWSVRATSVPRRKLQSARPVQFPHRRCCSHTPPFILLPPPPNLPTMNLFRPSFICASCARALRKTSHQTPTSRALSSTTLRNSRGVNDPEAGTIQPRWRQTPPAMTMPIRLRPTPPQPAWPVNDDDEILNRAYDEFLGGMGMGQKGRDLLDEPTKVLLKTPSMFPVEMGIFPSRRSGIEPVISSQT